MKTHSKTLPPALQRVEKTVPLETPDNFTFSPEQSTEIIQFLNDSVKIFDKSNLNLRVRIVFTKNDENSKNEKFKLPEIYLPIVNKFLNINPPLAPFSDLLKSAELTTMLQSITWVILFDIIDKSFCTEILENKRRMIYDRLSIDFSQLQMKLSNSTLSLSGRFIDLWCSVVCASLFSLILNLYEDSQLYRNSSFCLRIENDVRNLLIGFASPNVKDFHKSILSLMPNELKLAVPTIVTVGGEDYNPSDFTNTLKYEPQIVEAWNQRDNPMFQASSTTGLVQNAMKLKGAQVATPACKIGRPIKRGNVEKSGMPIAKAKIILLNTEKIVKSYQKDRSSMVNDLCATEESYSEIPNVPPITQLGISFENFGKSKEDVCFSPHPPDLIDEKSPRPKTASRNNDQKNELFVNINEKPRMMMKRPLTVRVSRRSDKSKTAPIPYQMKKMPQSTRERQPGSTRFKYRKVPDIPEVISAVSNINDYLTANPVFNS